MAIFKIVDKSEIWGCGCSGRMGVVIVEENLVGEGERCDGMEFWRYFLVAARCSFGSLRG